MLNIMDCIVAGVDFAVESNQLIPNITSLVVTLIKIAVPIILVIFGMLDLAKAVMSNDEKEMKGAQTKLIKRVVYAVIVFLVFTVVQILVGALAGTGTETNENISGCLNCFINGDCKSVK